MVAVVRAAMALVVAATAVVRPSQRGGGGGGGGGVSSDVLDSGPYRGCGIGANGAAVVVAVVKLVNSLCIVVVAVAKRVVERVAAVATEVVVAVEARAVEARAVEAREVVAARVVVVAKVVVVAVEKMAVEARAVEARARAVPSANLVPNLSRAAALGVAAHSMSLLIIKKLYYIGACLRLELRREL